MKKRCLNYVLLSVLAIIMVVSAFTPLFVHAQYTYGPEYTTSGMYGSAYYPDYYQSSYQNYPQQSYQDPYYYSYTSDPAYFGSQYYTPNYQTPSYYPQSQYPSYPYYQQYPYSYQYPYSSYPYYPYPYQYYPYSHYDEDRDPPLVVSCMPDASWAPVDSYVTWTAYASGGTGRYKYDWEGERFTSKDDEREVSIRYRDTGVKYADVTVRSGDQKVTRECPAVNILRRSW
jgi:hypothetical protein